VIVVAATAEAVIAAREGSLTREQMIPLLQEIQAAEGFISATAMLQVAEALETPVSRVYGVATFYNQFRFAPLGEHVIEGADRDEDESPEYDEVAEPRRLRQHARLRAHVYDDRPDAIAPAIEPLLARARSADAIEEAHDETKDNEHDDGEHEKNDALDRHSTFFSSSVSIGTISKRSPTIP